MILKVDFGDGDGMYMESPVVPRVGEEICGTVNEVTFRRRVVSVEYQVQRSHGIGSEVHRVDILTEWLKT